MEEVAINWGTLRKVISEPKLPTLPVYVKKTEINMTGLHVLY